MSYTHNAPALLSSKCSEERLDSWKEVASFFRKEVRTVQLWETREGLPVHRQHHNRLGSIYAYRRELEDWRVSRSLLARSKRTLAVSRSPAWPVTLPAEADQPEIAALSLRSHSVLLEPAHSEADPSADAKGRVSLFPEQLGSQSLAGLQSGSGKMAQDACSVGRHFWNQRSHKSILKGLRYFRDATQIDAHCFTAYAGLADSYVTLSYNHLMCPRKAAVKAREAIQIAMKLNGRSVTVKNSLINVLINSTWEWAEAERQCKLLVDSGHANGRTMQLYSGLMTRGARHDEAMELASHAISLDPLGSPVNTQIAFACFYAREYKMASEYASRILESRPQFTMGHALVGRIAAQIGDWDASLSACTRALEVSAGSVFSLAMVAYAHAGRGDLRSASNILRDLDQRPDERCLPHFEISAVHVILKDEQKALKHLVAAREAGDMKTIFAQHDPRFRKLASTDIFRRIVAMPHPNM